MSKEERAKVILPQDIKDILVGILLRDAHIAKRSATANSRLVYGQTTKHKEYFDYVLEFFKPYCDENYEFQYRTFTGKDGKTYFATSFTTLQLPCFNAFKDMFYIHNKKIVPYDIYNLLTPKSLAF